VFFANRSYKRKTYHDLVYNLLKPGGLIIGLWFPIGKALSEGGPPFAVSEKEVKSLFNNRWNIKKEEFPNNSVEPRSGREKLIVFKKL
jgi:Thiopurine S-methyltransferase (TPMT).